MQFLLLAHTRHRINERIKNSVGHERTTSRVFLSLWKCWISHEGACVIWLSADWFNHESGYFRERKMRLPSIITAEKVRSIHSEFIFDSTLLKLFLHQQMFIPQKGWALFYKLICAETKRFTYELRYLQLQQPL